MKGGCAWRGREAGLTEGPLNLAKAFGLHPGVAGAPKVLEQKSELGDFWSGEITAEQESGSVMREPG